MPPLLLLTSTLLLLLYPSSAATIGVTYNPSLPNLPPPDRVASTLQSLRIPAVRLLDLGIHTISVSTTFNFINIITTAAFPPSATEFHEPIGSLVLRPLLQFLDETNSSFLINLYPYHIFKINSEIPIGFVLFQTNPFNFRNDGVTGARYCNLFDMMVDAIVAAVTASGQENVPVIVAETGWPTGSEAEDAGNYAEMYLRGLIAHLRSGSGTPLRKEGAAEGYVYELFDEGIQRGTINSANGTSGDAAAEGEQWGILYPNMTMKYRFRFSDGIRLYHPRLARFLALICFLIVYLHYWKEFLEVLDFIFNG